jgi:hypothetical protein
LAQEHDATANAVVIGEEAHIVAQSVNGPRGKPPLNPEQRDAYSNLILLCPTHHNLVDSDEDAFPVARLLTMKKAHEAHVRTSLDASKLQNDEQWARIVDGITGWLEMDNWDDNFTGIFLGGEASLKTAWVEKLKGFLIWLAKRPWPVGHEHLRAICTDTGIVLNTFLYKFDEYSHEAGSYVRYETFYKLDRWDETLYKELLEEYKFNRALMEDLVLELTRHVNWFSDEVRKRLDPDYRFEEGYCSLKVGSGFGWSLVTPQFTDEERTQAHPFPDLEAFLSIRGSRNNVAGSY